MTYDRRLSETCAVIPSSGSKDALFWIQNRRKVSENFYNHTALINWHGYFVEIF